jgi:hypothetical protein
VKTGTVMGTTVVVLRVVAPPSSEEEREGVAVNPLDGSDRGRCAAHCNEDISTSAGGWCGAVALPETWPRPSCHGSSSEELLPERLSGRHFRLNKPKYRTL